MRLRYSIKSAIVPIFSPCCSANCSSSGIRAIVPSSFKISQITPAPISPAMWAKSTAASVCPARISTPPFCARSGKICPGCTMSCGCTLGDTAVWMVRARSAAEMPVVVPCAASMETVKLVPYCVPFCWVIIGKPSLSTRAFSIGRHTKPRACLIIKLMASGVTNWAAITKSPSFSRSSASVMMTILPALMSAMISGMGEICAVMAFPLWWWEAGGIVRFLRRLGFTFIYKIDCK